MREHTGASLGVAGVAVTALVTLGAVLVPLLWIALSVYALIKAIGSAPDSANPVVVLLIVVGLVTLSITGIAASLTLVGKSMTPKSRKRREREAQAEAGLLQRTASE